MSTEILYELSGEFLVIFFCESTDDDGYGREITITVTALVGDKL